MPPRPKPPPDSEIKESYLKGSGPGGQKINKTASAVQLIHEPTGIVVKCQATRSRSQNRKQAREILAQKVDDFLNGDQSRSAIVGEIKRRKARSAEKKSRKKYQKLEAEKMKSVSDPDSLESQDGGHPPAEVTRRPSDFTDSEKTTAAAVLEDAQDDSTRVTPSRFNGT